MNIIIKKFTSPVHLHAMLKSLVRRHNSFLTSQAQCKPIVSLCSPHQPAQSQRRLNYGDEQEKVWCDVIKYNEKEKKKKDKRKKQTKIGTMLTFINNLVKFESCTEKQCVQLQWAVKCDRRVYNPDLMTAG